jgi:predicted DNA-binding protein (MmcQ/YjbR family)
VASPTEPDELFAGVRSTCLALPETSERPSGVGSEFRVRRRTFAHVFTVEDPSGRTVSMLVCRADPEEREVLRAMGHPFFIPGSGVDRIGLLLDGDTDWTEVAELVTESYRLLAPKKLASLVDGPPGA